MHELQVAGQLCNLLPLHLPSDEVSHADMRVLAFELLNVAANIKCPLYLWAHAQLIVVETDHARLCLTYLGLQLQPVTLDKARKICICRPRLPVTHSALQLWRKTVQKARDLRTWLWQDETALRLVAHTSSHTEMRDFIRANK